MQQTLTKIKQFNVKNICTPFINTMLRKYGRNYKRITDYF